MTAPILPGTTAGMAVLLAVLLWYMPDLTRRELFFAVTVPGTFRDDPAGTAIRRRYRNELMVVSVAALALIVSSLFWRKPFFAPAMLYVQVAASYVVFFRARSRVLPYAVAPTTIREVELRTRPEIVPAGPFLAAGPFAILVLCAVYLWLHWNAIPIRFPVHYGMDGMPNRWSERSALAVAYPLLYAAATLTTLSLVLYGLTHWLRPVYSGGPKGAREIRFRRTCALLILALEYYLALQLSWVALSPLHARFSLSYRLAAGLVPLFIAIIGVTVLARMGQGGDAGTASTVPIGDRTPDRRWIWGTFYVNPDDPAVFVERRFGLGYTLNFGRPGAWLILGSSLLGLLVLALLVVARG